MRKSIYNFKYLNGTLAAATAICILVLFQNCSAPGSSGGTDSASLSAAQLNKPPFLITVPGPQIIRIGLGPNSGNVDLDRIPVKGSSGQGESGQTFVLKCELISDDIAVSGCGTFKADGTETFNIRAVAGKQCISGSATLTLWIEDEFTDSPKQTVPITIVNACPNETRLVPNDVEKLDQFGAAVAIEGSTAVAISPGDDGSGNLLSKVGAAYVFTLNGSTWTQTQKLYVTGGAAGDSLSSVAISGGTIVVGSPYNQGRGSAYVFQKNGSGVWTQMAALSPTGGNASGNDYFATSVAINGNTILVGAPGDGSTQNGATYVYTGSGASWSLQSKLQPSSATPYLAFGTSVAINGNTAVVGGPMAPLNESFGTGLAFVFSRSGTLWSESKVLTPPASLAMGAHYGFDVDMTSGWIVIGADRATTTPGSTGAVYLSRLTGGTWSDVQPLNESLVNVGDEYGFSVAIEGNNLLVGARSDTSRRGAVYYYTWNATTSMWERRFKLLSRMAADLDQFGSDVDLSGTRALVGVRLDDESPDGVTKLDGSGSSSIIVLP